jgi:hypothetical protein
MPIITLPKEPFIMTDATDFDANDSEQPVSHIPVNIQGARDLTATEAEGYEAAIDKAMNVEELKQIGDGIVAGTGYGVSHILNIESFAHTMAFSGLPRASALAKQMEAKSKKMSSASGLVSLDEGFHGYRDTLYDVDNVDLGS